MATPDATAELPGLADQAHAKALAAIDLADHDLESAREKMLTAAILLNLAVAYIDKARTGRMPHRSPFVLH